MADQDRLAEIKAWHDDPRWWAPGPSCDDALDWLIDEVDRLRRLLTRLEWAGTVVFDEWYDKGKCCPVCKGEPDDGHTDDCELADVLGRTQKGAPPLP